MKTVSNNYLIRKNSIQKCISNDTHNNTDLRENCIVCLDNVIFEEDLFITKCSHSFHRNCFHIWIKNNKSCPLCKNDFTKEEILINKCRNNLDKKEEILINKCRNKSIKIEEILINKCRNNSIKIEEILINKCRYFR